VIVDLDGVLIASESVWAAVRRQFTLAHGGTWSETEQKAMGMSSPEWTSASPAGLMRPPLPWWMKWPAATGSMCRLVLRQDAPALTSSPLDHLVDDRDREHDHDDARGQPGEQRVTPPETGVDDVRDDATDQRRKRDRRQDSRLSQIGLDRPRASRTRIVAPHCAGSNSLLGVYEMR